MNSLAKEIAERIQKMYADRWYSGSQDLTLEAAALIDSALPKWVEVTPETMPKFPENKDSVPCVCLTDDGQRISMDWARNRFASTARGQAPRWEWHSRVATWKVIYYIPISALPAAPSTDQHDKAGALAEEK